MSNTPDTPSDVDNDQQDNIELDLQPVPDDSEIKAQADQQAVAELEQALQEANDRADANGILCLPDISKQHTNIHSFFVIYLGFVKPLVL